jgi:oligopeptidase A
MLTRVEHGDAAGINGVEWDAVELPSQFMENWCYDKKTLYSFARYESTNLQAINHAMLMIPIAS